MIFLTLVYCTYNSHSTQSKNFFLLCYVIHDVMCNILYIVLCSTHLLVVKLNIIKGFYMVFMIKYINNIEKRPCVWRVWVCGAYHFLLYVIFRNIKSNRKQFFILLFLSFLFYVLFLRNTIVHRCVYCSYNTLLL